MPVTSIAGYTVTVKFGSSYYSAQIMAGTVTRAINVTTEHTLGPNQVDTATSKTDTININGLYDGADGIYDALWASTETLSTVAVVLYDGSAKKWSGNVLVQDLPFEFDAENSSKFSCSLIGPLTRATGT